MNLSERARLYEEAFTAAGGDGVVAAAQLAYIVESLTSDSNLPDDDSDIELDELAWSFESLGLEHNRAGASEEDIIGIFEKSFRLRTGMVARGLIKDLPSLWLLITSGVASQNQPQLREILAEYTWPQLEPIEGDASWEDRLVLEATKAVFYLTRKANGWIDVDAALGALGALVEMQSEYEPAALSSYDSSVNPAGGRSRMVGLYHLAEALTLLGRYLRTGDPESILPTLDRHIEHGRYLLQSAGSENHSKVASAASLLLPALVRASIWHNTTRLSEAARNFAKRLAGGSENSPVLELWWSQRQALANNLLDPFRVAVGVQLPTSAGKTLLAEFTIIQALALNPNSSVAYVVPTRALVNQITKRLRADLSGDFTGSRIISVESAAPVFELDPTEDVFLRNTPDVLVTTPEKLDLLVRSKHPCVRNIALVVVDEAHLISEPHRGPRLELLLATLKRERGAACRFLLLTPFLPNADELAKWLGDDAYAAISLDWRPSLQVRAIGKWSRSKKKYYDTLEIVPSHTQPESWEGHKIDLGEAKVQLAARSRPEISASIAASLSDSGATTLILTQGPGTAETRAISVAQKISSPAWAPQDRDLIDDVLSYVRSELGEDYPLVGTLRQGVAFHHAGMPPEVRALVETLLERGLVRVVAGTTTLAQGVNFPLSSVIVETLKVPQGRGKKYRPLLYSEFWNIAGRAGRALKDRVGVVVWPSDGAAKDVEYVDYLKGEAANVVSALATTLASLGEAEVQYGLGLVRSNPALSSFLQYLSHALRVAGYEKATAEVEDILRSSLVFHKLRQEDRESAERLVRWSQGFLRDASTKKLLDVADTTGLSLPSVGLLSQTATTEMHDPEFWLPENIFGEDLRPLTQVISLLSNVPEMSLGLEDSGDFNAFRVARIVQGWVTGASLPELARECFPSQDIEKSLRNVGRYLFRELSGQVPWGMGALQLVTMSSASESPARRRGSYVPAMAYYGVQSEGAVAMRMAGVPRPVAETLGARAPSFESFDQAREWLRRCPEEWWNEGAENRGFESGTMKRVWTLVGQG